MGVPKSINFWVETISIILSVMLNSVKEEDTEIEEGPVEYVDPETGKEVEELAYKVKIDLTGQEVMELVMSLGGYNDLRDLLKNPKFKNFPMYKPSIRATLLFVPDKLWNAEFSENNKNISDATNEFDPRNIKLSKLGGDNVVYVGNNFSFTIYLPMLWYQETNIINIEKFRKLMKPVIAHEVNHAFENYSKFKNTEDPLYGQGGFLNTAVRLMKDKKYPQWNEFLTLVYLHLHFEINARITQLYYEMERDNVTTKEEFMDTLKKSSVWKEIKKLEDFNTQKFMDSFISDDGDFADMLSDVGTQLQRRLQGLPTIDAKTDPKEGMKHLIDGWDIVLQTLNKEFKGVYKGKLMDEVPAKAKEDPTIFFKFFEDRFHKKAKTFKKKALRLASFIDNKKNEKSN